DEVECGHHYARAMSSWTLLLALSGFRWDATTGTLAFAPEVNEDDFRCFFSAGAGWGVFEQRWEGGRYSACITLREGELALRTLQLPLPDGAQAGITLDGAPVKATTTGGSISFAAPLRL